MLPQGHPVDLVVGDSLVAGGLAVHHNPVPLRGAQVGHQEHVGPPGAPKPRGLEPEEGEGVADCLLEGRGIGGVVCRMPELTNQFKDVCLKFGRFHQHSGGLRSFLLDGPRFHLSGLLDIQSLEEGPTSRRLRQSPLFIEREKPR